MKLTPSLRFNDMKCAEAIEFYKDCFPGAEVFVMKAKETPMADQFDPAKQEMIVHAAIKVGDMSLVLSDMIRDKATIGDHLGIMVECDSEEQLNALFSKLEQGGQVFMKPQKEFWGAVFGVVTDKYGFEWSLNYTLPKQ